MKKLLTKTQQHKKDRLNQLIIGILLISLMLFSTLGYALSDKDNEDKESVDYNGITFTRTNNYWTFDYNQQTFNTLYNPEEVKEIPRQIKSKLSDYSQKPLYIVGPIEEPALEIIRNINPFILRVNIACLPNTNCTTDSPIKNISTDNIIIIQEPAENQKENLYQQERAVFITASFENQTRYADAFLFNVLGIQ